MRVLTLPEVATLTGRVGYSLGLPMSQGETVKLNFHEHFIKFQMAQENYFENIVKVLNNDDLDTLLLCDRGVLDCMAYMEPESHLRILRRNDWTMNYLSNSRYNGIVHLVTAADGAESFYTTSNNRVRTETPEEARKLDTRIQEAWAGHDDHTIIGNHCPGGFHDKMEAVIKTVSRIVGVPDAGYTLKKCLVDSSFDPRTIPSDFIKRNYTVRVDYLETGEKDIDIYLTKRVD